MTKHSQPISATTPFGQHISVAGGSNATASLAGIAQALFALPTTLFDAACRAQSAYENRQAVADLDARLLDDVGLTRDDAVRASRSPLWR